jgi:hypothetical protein
MLATHDVVAAAVLLLPPLAVLPPLLPQPATASAPSAAVAMITRLFMGTASVFVML